MRPAPQRLFSVLIVGIFAVGANWNQAIAGDLDATFVKKVPTLRTEIERGKDAAMECVAVVDLESHDRCLDRIESSLRLKNELNEPFELGFNLWGLLSFNMVYEVAAERNRLNTRHVELAKVTQGSRYAKIKRLQSTLNLSEDDVCAIFFKRAEQCRQLLTRWSVSVR